MASSTAVAKVMVELDTFDGILINIFKCLHVDDMSSSGQRILKDDNRIITLIPSQTQNDIINCTVVSKRFHKIISTYEEEKGTKYWILIPVFEISPPLPSSGRVSSVSRFINKMRDLSLDAEIVKKQHFRHLNLNNIHEINHDVSEDEMNAMIDRNGRNSQYIRNGMSDNNGRNMQLKGIRSIQIVPSSTGSDDIDGLVQSARYVMNMTPNVREINLSSFNARELCLPFCDLLPTTVETIRWDNIHFNSEWPLNGVGMSNQNNLKQIFMDDSYFHCGPKVDEVGYANYEAEGEEEADNNNNDNNNDENNGVENAFIFDSCCEKLERVSIRNAHYVEGYYSDEKKSVIVKSVTQKALIKFVRNAPPTLQWFRSDLSPENMEMLRFDFPHIEFLN